MTWTKTQVVSGLLLATLLSAPAAIGQDATSQEIEALKKEIQALKQGQAAIQKQLQLITTLLNSNNRARRPTPPKEFTLDLSERPYKGEQDARLTLVEFSDYQ